MRHPFENLQLWDRPDAKNGAEHMALDEAMLHLAPRPALRVYRWRSAEVTFGYPVHWNDAEAFAAGRPATRRCTGGGLVEHGRDVTIALTAPATHPFARIAPREAYRWIHEAMHTALGDSTVALAAHGSPAAACFAAPSPHDLVAGPRKIAGGALRRSREGLLYQGSLLHDAVPGDFPMRLAHALASDPEPWHPPAGIEALSAQFVRDRYGRPEWNRRR